MNRPCFKITLLAGLALLMNTAVAAQNTVVFENTWIAEAPPGAQVMAAYMDIKNTGDKTLKLVPPVSDDFKKIEFHHSIDENGMARMQLQPELVIPANSTLSLKPGSYHMMLFNPVKKMKAGDQSTLVFKIKNSDTIKVIADIKKPVFKKPDNHSGHHHH